MRSNMRTTCRLAVLAVLAVLAGLAMTCYTRVAWLLVKPPRSFASTAMADQSLSMSALRVAVYAPRDGEMRALALELAAARRDHFRLSEHFAWMEARHDTYIVALTADNAMLQQQLDMLEQHLRVARDYRVYAHSFRAEREIRLTREGDRLARWAAQGRVEEDMPIEVWRAVRLMRLGDGIARIPVGTFAFVEMAAVP